MSGASQRVEYEAAVRRQIRRRGAALAGTNHSGSRVCYRRQAVHDGVSSSLMDSVTKKLDPGTRLDKVQNTDCHIDA